jgi:hypothetical protein
MRRLNFIAAASASAVLACAIAAHADEFPASGAEAKKGVVFIAGNIGDDTTYAVLGAVHALNGDINRDGFLIHVSGEVLNYDYFATPPATTRFSADGWGAAAMGGYQLVWPNGKVAGYAGVGHRDIQVSPLDPFSETAGENTSFKGQLEGYFGIGGSFDLSGLASYLSNADSYYGRVRGGFRLGGIVIGPEVAAHGSEEYDTQEYGGFVRLVATETVVLGARGGYADRDSTRGDDGGYFGVEAAFGY